MSSNKGDLLDVRTPQDIVMVRHNVRQRAVEVGLGLVDQTKIVTAASELARNTVIHGGGGTVTIERGELRGRKGVRLIFEDHGPGIPDIDRAMKDGYTTRDGLGLGLGGAKRLCNEFAIESTLGIGTRVTIARWT